VESNEDITQLPSTNLKREEKESSKENKMREFVEEEKKNDYIEKETKTKEKEKEIIQEQQQQTIENNEIIQLTNNDSHEEKKKKEINKEKPYVKEGCKSEVEIINTSEIVKQKKKKKDFIEDKNDENGSLFLEETGKEKKNKTNYLTDEKEFGKKEIESAIFSDVDTSQAKKKTKKKHKAEVQSPSTEKRKKNFVETNEIEVSEIDSKVEERKNKSEKKRKKKELENIKKHKEQYKEIHLSQDPGINSVLVREFVSENKETLQEENDDL
jgi:hypothetical protein